MKHSTTVLVSNKVLVFLAITVEGSQINIGGSLIDVGIAVGSTKYTDRCISYMAIQISQMNRSSYLCITNAANANIRDDKPAGCFTNYTQGCQIKI